MLLKRRETQRKDHREAQREKINLKNSDVLFKVSGLEALALKFADYVKDIIYKALNPILQMIVVLDFPHR